MSELFTCSTAQKFADAVQIIIKATTEPVHSYYIESIYQQWSKYALQFLSTSIVSFTALVA